MLVNEDFYRRKVGKVLAHIARNLDQDDADFSLDTLAGIAGMSKFHFHRQFAAITGITVTRLISVVRLKKASMRLAFQPEARVTDIALDAGYESPEAFARAFRDLVGQSPSGFRAEPSWDVWAQVFRTPYTQGDQMLDVAVIEFPQTMVAALEHHGSPQRLMATVARFIEWRKSSGESPVKTSQTFGVAFSDPGSVPPEEFRFDVCGSVTAPVADNAFGVVTKYIAGGLCARITHVGSTDAMGPTVMRLYREWLPSSGRTLRDAPLFFHYKKRMPEVSEFEQVTDIYLPIA